MQEATLPKWAKPKKSAPPKDEPVAENVAAEPAADDSPAPVLPPADQSVVTAIGLRPCTNARWVLADLNGTKIKVRVLNVRKSPKGQPMQCRHLEADHYEEIR